MGRLSLWVLLGLTMFALSLQDVQVSADVGPTESECRPYIEKAINELKTGETTESAEAGEDSQNGESVEDTGDGLASKEEANDAESTEQDDDEPETDETTEEGIVETVETVEQSEEETTENTEEPADHSEENDDQADTEETEGDVEKSEEAPQSQEESEADDQKSEETADEGKSEEEAAERLGDEEKSEEEEDPTPSEEDGEAKLDDDEGEEKEDKDDTTTTEEESGEEEEKPTEGIAEENTEEDQSEEEKPTEEVGSEEGDEKEGDETEEEEEQSAEQKDEDDDKTDEADDEDEIKSRGKRSLVEEEEEKEETTAESKEDETKEEVSGEEVSEAEDKEDTEEDDSKEGETKEDNETGDESEEGDADDKEADETEESAEDEDKEESRPEDDLLLEVEIPENLRDRKHIDELLHLDDEFEEREKAIDRVAEIILRDLKRIYENAVKPLETLYKYRDLSNRHFSDPEIFSKPLILFMGPWSGGKSTIINYLTENEYTPYSLRAGAEPSPAYFNIVMYGNETEVLDGTQLAADWTFSGLQKFGQGLEDRLRGLKLPNKLLEKVNIVEIPGILEVRKQVSRLFPFNDACQWFIDRADIIFLVYDPAKLDVGPETEAILDQLKGREYQTRIILNKADTVKPEELLRVQSALIWNISPLMSSAQPPIMYTTSLWSHPYESTSPIRLLQAQERAFLRDIRSAVDKRIENKIASARRFAVRVRNHAKMVDCYLTTYYNHKTLFGNKKRIADQIIENPQNYHIYEGLSTLTNISRYDLPDPEVYRDFFRLNPLYEFKKLSETCTYFRGCPINKLDVAIAYDLPELVGKYKKMAESALAGLESTDQGKS